jgi:PD-(D/E)XK endonuclease
VPLTRPAQPLMEEEMRNTKKIGDVSEAKILAALLAKGYVVLKPFGDNERYDLVIEKDGKFSRVQCKTGWLTKSKNSILVSMKSVSSNGKNIRYYDTSQVEFFGVYYSKLDKCYLVPLVGLPEASFTLTFEERPYNGGPVPRIAKDFEL